jgi:hypothetical protein
MSQRFIKTTHAAWRAARVATLAGTVFTVPVTRDFKAAPSGQAAQECKFAVVPCNYAHLYSGTISWTESTNSSAGSFNATVGVTVKDGVGVCTGSETSVSISQFGRTSRTGTIGGKALVAVEFDFYEEVSGSANQPNRPMGYKVTAACPSADYPATSDGSAATPATPAELDGRERSSYPQLATGVEQKQLNGSNSSKPEEDTVNGVTSLLVVKWDLKKP